VAYLSAALSGVNAKSQMAPALKKAAMTDTVSPPLGGRQVPLPKTAFSFLIMLKFYKNVNT